jgi:hypothetical protein
MHGIQRLGIVGHFKDVTIWDSSQLLQLICNGSIEENDFCFRIGREQFDKLWMLVDGIYPLIALFVKPLTVPIGDTEALLSLWQEAKRKYVKRFFGVLKTFFVQAIPLAFIGEMIDAFYSCLILHNIAVKERMDSNGALECKSYYDCVEKPSKVSKKSNRSRVIA